MSSHKSQTTIYPYLTAMSDRNETRFIRIGNSLLTSSEFGRLSNGAQILYLCFAMEADGSSEFQFPQSTAIKYDFAPASFWRYVKELEENRFITVTSNKNLRQPNHYQFCLDWKKA